MDDDLDQQVTSRRWTQTNSGTVTALRLPCDPESWPNRVHLTWFIIGKPEKGYVRWHRNGDHLDYRRDNLEWRTFAQVAEWGRKQNRLQRQFDKIAVPKAVLKH